MVSYNNMSLFYFHGLIILACNIYFTEAFHFEGSLPDPTLFSKILNEFLGPMMRSYSGHHLVSSNFKNQLVHKAIIEKVKELKPLLQDNDETPDEEKFILEDKDDTTIIDFLPKTDERKKKVEDSVFKSHIKKYKKIREKIDRALTKEEVSEKTKNLVVKTLDGLIKSLLSSQCKWKKNLRSVKGEKPSDIASKLNSGFQRIKEILMNFFNNRTVHTRRNDDVLNLLDAIQVVFRGVTDDVDVISKKYKILCELLPKKHNNPLKYEEMNANALRNNWEKSDREEDRCQNVYVCTNELEEFMENFYYALNDTTISVIKNYIAMYTRDVNVDDENEKQVIISLLDKITPNLEEGMAKVFVKETEKLKLDEAKNNRANVKTMTHYVMNTFESVKRFAKQLLKSELVILREKIFSNILDDINVNLDVDLDNLEQEFINKICETFYVCNGRYKGRRRSSNNLNKNNLYVQMKLTLDDDLTNMTDYRKFILPSENSTFKRFTNSFANVTVTRTTLINLTLDDDLTNMTDYRKFILPSENSTFKRFTNSFANVTVTRTTLINNRIIADARGFVRVEPN